MDKEMWVAVSVFSLLALVFVLILGAALGGQGVRDEAIEAGVAEWRVDPKSGKTTFVYLPRETVCTDCEVESK